MFDLGPIVGGVLLVALLAGALRLVRLGAGALRTGRFKAPWRTDELEGPAAAVAGLMSLAIAAILVSLAARIVRGIAGG